MTVLFEKELRSYRLKSWFSEDMLKLFLSIEHPHEKLKQQEAAEAAQRSQGEKEKEEKPKTKEKITKKEFPPVEPLLWEELLNVLNEFAPTDRFHIDVLKDALQKLNTGESIESRRIAKGKETEHGRDGKIVYLIRVYDRKGGTPPKKAGSESAFIDLNGFQMVDVIEIGRIVARIYPPTLGTPGEDAIGRSLASNPGKPAEMNVDETLSIKPPEQNSGFQTIVANAAGYVENISNTLCVFHELRLRGLLDHEVGNIRFNGKVIIQGDVASDIQVSGPDGVDVKGTVDGGSLSAERGQIVIDGNLIGSRKSRIQAAQLVNIKRGQTADIDCSGDVIFHDYLTNCVIRSRGLVFSERGTLQGGAIFSVKGIQVKELGNDSGLRTVVVLCSAVETTQEFTEVTQRIAEHERGIQVLEMHLAHFAKMPERIQLLAPTHREKMTKLYEKLVALRQSYEILQRKKASFLEHAQFEAVPPVNVLSKAHIGVQIIAKGIQWSVTETIDGPCSLVLDEQQKAFIKQPLQALTPSALEGKGDKKKK